MQKRSWIIWVAAFIGWVLIGLSFSVSDYLFTDALARYYQASPSLRSMLFWDLAYWPTWAVLAPLIFLTARRFPLGRYNWYPNLFINLSVGLLLIIPQRAIYLSIAWLFQTAIGEKISLLNLYREFLLYNLPTGFMSYGVILLVSHLINYYKRYQEEELLASRLKAELTETQLQMTQAQLQALKMQLQPHFLFNTLNSISALLDEDAKAADEMLARLGDFLRLTLENPGAQAVTLEEELEFLRRYLEIEQVRLQDSLQVRYDIESQTLAAQVPNLILQPIIENAIKHGIGQNPGPGEIAVSAKRKNGKLCLQIKDNGAGLPNNGNGCKEGFGITNTRARLKSTYGFDYRFELMSAPDGGTEVILEMPFVATEENIKAAT